MKKIWWQAGACLLLVILIVVIVYAFRHDRTPATAVYEEPPAADDSPASYDNRYPIGRNRGVPGEAMPVQEPAPAYAGRPVDRGPAFNGQGGQGPRPQDMGPADDAPQHGMPPGETPPGPEVTDQDPGGPYEDGNPEDVPPPESLPDD